MKIVTEDLPVSFVNDTEAGIMFWMVWLSPDQFGIVPSSTQEFPKSMNLQEAKRAMDLDIYRCRIERELGGDIEAITVCAKAVLELLE